MTEEEQSALDREIAELIRKEAVEETLPDEVGYISPMFIVPKKGGKWRPILNLKGLNQYVRKSHFKMEDIRSVKDIIQPGDYMAKLDLREAYFSVPVNHTSRKFLQFRWRNKLLQFTCLPFGLSSAPFVFTKLLRPALAQLREQGIRCLMYLDDMLILGKTKEELSRNYQRCRSLLISLGFILNDEKSIPGPVQVIEFLGFVINSLTMTFSVTREKLSSLRSECKALLKVGEMSVRSLAKIIGIMTSVKPAILPAPLHYRGLQELKNDSLNLHHSYDSMVPLSSKAKTDLEWWMEKSFVWNSKPILPAQPSLTLESDASNHGWGATQVEPRVSTGGVWNTKESLLHINAKELLAAWLAIQCFAARLSNTHIHFRIDNTTAVAQINKMGGTHSSTLCQIALNMWEWCLQRKITISAEHLPGTLNQIADMESRAKADSSEWSLNLETFQKLMRTRGPCTVDLFASRLSAKLPTYYSWKADPGATAVDALYQTWSTVRGYAFPPFCLIGRCLAKVKTEKVPWLLIITPLWKAQSWFPVLLRMLIDFPVILPSNPNLLKDPQGNSHSMILQGHLQLVAWTVSGIDSKVVEFQKGLLESYVHHGDTTPKHLIRVVGDFGANGAPREVSIPLMHL